ncbi:MAG: hypothetical protein KGN02_08315 [bacterium]|nr:hypothetical protein [bacterium]
MRKTYLALAFTVLLAACGGGGAGSSATPALPVAAPQPTAPAPTATAVSVSVGTSQGAVAAVWAGTTAMGVSVPATASGSGVLSIGGSAGLPLSIVSELGVTIYGCVLLASPSDLTFASTPGITATVAAGTPIAGHALYLQLLDSYTNRVTMPLGGAVIATGQTVTFASPSQPLSLTKGAGQALCVYEPVF